MMTTVKVRDRLNSYDEDPGWYEHPKGTVALKATDQELRRDGIDVAMANGSGKRSPDKKTAGHGAH
jgi:hypothetical protein